MKAIYEFKSKEFVAIVDSMIKAPVEGGHDAEVYVAVRLAILDMAKSARSGLHSRVVRITAAESEQPGCRCRPRCPCLCGQGGD